MYTNRFIVTYVMVTMANDKGIDFFPFGLRQAIIRFASEQSNPSHKNEIHFFFCYYREKCGSFFDSQHNYFEIKIIDLFET